MKTNKEYNKWLVLKILHKNYPNHSFKIKKNKIIVDGKETRVILNATLPKVDHDVVEFLTSKETKLHLFSKMPIKIFLN